MFSNETGYMGDDGFIWFHGVVEDIFDPEQLGRVRVRVLGDHTQDLGRIPKEHLPWAIVACPAYDASVSGVGQSPTGIMQGSWVIGFYRDGLNRQQPVVLFSNVGLPEVPPDASIGFNDPDECYPHLIDEPDTNRLVRGESGGKYSAPHPATDMRRELVEEGPLGACGDTIIEPETPYNTEYPWNQVWEGPYSPDCDGYDWGHIIEWDSTPENERYLRWHKSSMNFLEIHVDGTEVHKMFGDHYEIDMANKNLILKGDWNISVLGDKKEYIGGNYCLHVGGNYTQKIDGHKEKTIGEYDKEVVGDYKQSTINSTETKLVKSDRSKTVQGNETEEINGTKTSTIDGDETKNANSNRTINTSSDETKIIGGENSISIGSNETKTIAVNENITVGGARTKIISGNDSTTATNIEEFASTIGMYASDIILDGAVAVAASNVTSFEETHDDPPEHMGTLAETFDVFTPGVI